MDVPTMEQHAQATAADMVRDALERLVERPAVQALEGDPDVGPWLDFARAALDYATAHERPGRTFF